MKYFLLLLLSIFIFPSVFGLTPDFSCPDAVNLNEEFTCTISVHDFESPLDLKIDLRDGTKSIAKIYDPEKEDWKSAFYYLVGFIQSSNEYTFKLKIQEEGSFTGALKLRGSSTESFDFDIVVKNSGGDSDEEEQNVEDEDSQESQEGNGGDSSDVSDTEGGIDKKYSDISFDKKSVPVTGGVIVLNEQDAVALDEQGNSPLKKELIYQSKSSLGLDYAPYVFSFLLIVVLAVILFQKF